jgi:U1 small nuclear ribonucleoprotein
VTDTRQDEKPSKKKKKHRGYAFVVYEREKDMRGNPTITPLYPRIRCLGYSIMRFLCGVMALKLPTSFFF